MNNKTKYPRYQDYVIKDGAFIGDFESMYQDFDDPWEQSSAEPYASEKAIILNLMQKHGVKKALELGCGFGHFTEQIRLSGIEATGIDVSKTAVNKARTKYPDCQFYVSDILNFEIYDKCTPDVLVMPEITWYVLDKLDEFMGYIKAQQKNTYLAHMLTTYPKGVQRYGVDKFTNLSQIMSYFDLRYLEWGEINSAELSGCKRTYFWAKI